MGVIRCDYSSVAEQEVVNLYTWVQFSVVTPNNIILVSLNGKAPVLDTGAEGSNPSTLTNLYRSIG